jgi:hypothetical protein
MGMGLDIAVRMSDVDVKAGIVQRATLKVERNTLLESVDIGALEAGINPVVLMGLMNKVADFKRAFELTRQIELISDALVREQILRVVDSEEVVDG